MTYCTVETIKQVGPAVYQVILQAEQRVDHKPGQYLYLLMDETTRRAFSIASIHDGSNRLELHVGGAEPSRYLDEVLEYLNNRYRQGLRLRIDAPHGRAWLREKSDRPMLLIAGGTGFSYIQSILRYSLVHFPDREVFLYWGGRYQAHLYFDSELAGLVKRHKQFTYVPVVETASVEWSGKVGQVISAVCEEFESLESMDIYLCGNPGMIKEARDIFVTTKKADIACIVSDVLM
ncbi:NAD(P)H-flavin reductase [Kistimonas asteriae]|uniref:NAD(P)H-flavin reductase n=1 Tax=Kistimonas asteriae TaxID=517724 RepID=UPI001BADAA00|nr:NAD(P)H-flavin reductase [Kistimonas asteriae]